MTAVVRVRAIGLAFALWGVGCDQRPDTSVIVDNRYRPSTPNPVIIYAYWQAVSFAQAIPPGSSSDAASTVPASANTAYVVLAPGWDADSSTPAASFVVMQSREGFGMHLNDRLHIPVDDTTFAGNCAAGSFLSQSQADFITQRIFPDVFAAFTYEAATCTTTPISDAGAD